MGFIARARIRLLRSSARLGAELVRLSSRRAAARRDAAEHQLPGDGDRRGSRSPGSASASTTTSCGWSTRTMRAAPLPDLRLRAVLRGRAGDRPLGGARGADLDHPGPLRPHRPRGPRAAAGLGPGPDLPRRARERRRRHVSPKDPAQRARRAAAPDRPSRPPLLRARRPRDRRRRLRRPAGRAAGARGGEPGAAHAGLADPAGRRAAARQVRAGAPRRADALARQRPRGR